jgi:hypothetical protein
LDIHVVALQKEAARRLHTCSTPNVTIKGVTPRLSRIVACAIDEAPASLRAGWSMLHCVQPLCSLRSMSPYVDLSCYKTCPAFARHKRHPIN